MWIFIYEVFYDQIADQFSVNFTCFYRYYVVVLHFHLISVNNFTYLSKHSLIESFQGVYVVVEGEIEVEYENCVTELSVQTSLRQLIYGTNLETR